MAAITTTAAQVAIVGEVEPEIRTYIAAAAITAGQAVYLDSTGKVNLARANAVSTSYFVGIALRSVSAGQAVSVLQRGSLVGFDLSGVAYNGFVHLSSGTAGGLDTAAATGTGNVVAPVGRVVSMPDMGILTKVLFVNVPYNTILTAL
jgi:hypothetical protein